MRERMTFDCRQCPVRGSACADCVVTAFLATPAQPDSVMPLEPDEWAAVSLMVSAGLVGAADVVGLVARRVDLPLVREVG